MDEVYFYAQLKFNNICFGVSMLAGEVTSPDMVLVSTNDPDFIFRKYENGEWSEEKYVPDYAQIELSRMEELERSQAEQDDLLMDLMLGRV